MRQDQLTRESQKCDHGFAFGTTCEKCEIARLKESIAELVEQIEVARDRFDASVESAASDYGERGSVLTDRRALAGLSEALRKLRAIAEDRE